MVADDRQSAAGGQQFHRRRQAGSQLIQFVIDGNPQGLKDAGGRVDTALAAPVADYFRHYRRQLAGGMQWPLSDYGPRYRPGPGFLAILGQQPGQIPLRPSVDQVRRRRQVHRRVKAHIQRFLPPETAAETRFIQLPGTEAQIQQNAIGFSRSAPGLPGQFPHSGIAALDRDKPGRLAGCGRVLVKGRQAGRDPD